MRSITVVGCLLLAGVIGCSTGLADALDVGETGCMVPEDSGEFINETLTLVNRERELRGLQPVVLNEGLAAVAGNYACRMIEDGFFGHTNPLTGERFEDRHAKSEFRCCPSGENLVMGHTSPTAVVEDWMESVLHRNVILAEEYVQIGLGVREDPSTGELYWVLWLVREPICGCGSDAAASEPGESDPGL